MPRACFTTTVPNEYEKKKPSDWMAPSPPRAKRSAIAVEPATYGAYSPSRTASVRPTVRNCSY